MQEGTEKRMQWGGGGGVGKQVHNREELLRNCQRSGDETRPHRAQLLASRDLVAALAVPFANAQDRVHCFEVTT